MKSIVKHEGKAKRNRLYKKQKMYVCLVHYTEYTHNLYSSAFHVVDCIWIDTDIATDLAPYGSSPERSTYNIALYLFCTAWHNLISIDFEYALRAQMSNFDLSDFCITKFIHRFNSILIYSYDVEQSCDVVILNA